MHHMVVEQNHVESEHETRVPHAVMFTALVDLSEREVTKALFVNEQSNKSWRFNEALLYLEVASEQVLWYNEVKDFRRIDLSVI